MRRALTPILLAVAAGAALPAPAAGHGAAGISGDTILYSERDATGQSTVTVTVEARRVRIEDRTVDGGISPGQCEPGAVGSGGVIVEAICPRNGASRLRIDVGDREDSVTIREAAGAPPLPSLVIGGNGADRLSGGAGPDRLHGGPGVDELDGGGGDDELLARDGATEQIVCGGGADRAVVDPLDAVELGCEDAQRAAVGPEGDPPPGSGGGADPHAPPGDPQDQTPPAVEGQAPTRQRTGRSGVIAVQARPDEAAEVAAAAVVRIGSRRFAVKPARTRVVAGELAVLRLRLGTGARRALRRALARRRRADAVVSVVATDAAGNSTAIRLPRVRLVR